MARMAGTRMKPNNYVKFLESCYKWTHCTPRLLFVMRDIHADKTLSPGRGAFTSSGRTAGTTTPPPSGGTCPTA